MTIDWESQELYRKYKKLEPVKKKLLLWMKKERDLYFVIGNTWRWRKSYMIISLIYPPRGEKMMPPLIVHMPDITSKSRI